MQLFVRGLESRSVGYELCTDSTVGQLKVMIEAHDGLPRACQGLVYAGRQLHDDERSLSQCGVGACSTVHLVLRLVGGKGGFGALLRGQGRNGEVTTNFDACRDLTGRRLRHAEAEAKLREWRACQKDREAVLAAEKREREEAKAAKREAAAEIDEVQVRAEQKVATRKVLDAVHDALRAAPLPGTLAAKRSAVLTGAAAAGPSKRAKFMSALGSDDESGSSSEEEDEEEVAAAEAGSGPSSS